MSDTELLNALEKFIAREGGLLIHNDGYWKCGGYPGLGLRCTSRTLRQALEQALLHPAESPARTSKEGECER